LETSEDKVLSSIEEREKRLKDKERELKKWQRRLLELSAEKLIEQAFCMRSIKIVRGKWEGISSEILREYAEKIRNKLKEGVVVLASVSQSKAFLAAASTQKNLPANQILREVARLAGGSAGGRWDFAQGGIPQPSKIDQALEKVPTIVEKFGNSPATKSPGHKEVI
jgi:alanyl-tRNA synthetase